MNKQLGWGIALAFVASTGLAGTAQIDSGGTISTVEYRDGGYMRMGAGNDAYMLVRDNKMYMVNGTPGQEMVIDAGSVLGMIGNMVPETGTNASEVGSVDKTGRRETVAGIEGEVWVISYLDAEGRQQSTEAVVSTDARAAEFRNAMEDFSRAMLSAMGKDPDALNAMDDTLRGEGVGLLRFGDAMKIVNLTSDTVSASRFELPAEPTSLAELTGFGGGASTATDGSQGGGFGLGGIFTRQLERQQEQVGSRTQQELDQAVDSQADRFGLGGIFGRQAQSDASLEERVQDEVDQAADSATDRVVDGALNRLFGR